MLDIYSQLLLYKELAYFNIEKSDENR